MWHHVATNGVPRQLDTTSGFPENDHFGILTGGLSTYGHTHFWCFQTQPLQGAPGNHAAIVEGDGSLSLCG